MGCCLFALSHPAEGSRLLLLKALVLAGAMLQIFGRGAKFSMFKPAEGKPIAEQPAASACATMAGN